MKSSMKLKSIECIHFYLNLIHQKLEMVEIRLEGGQQFLREFWRVKLILCEFECQLQRFEDMNSDWDRR